MAVAYRAGLCITVLACVLLGACSAGSSGGGGDCVSRYHNVASAPDWPRLSGALLKYDERGRSASVRIQAKGDDVDSPGGKDVVRVVDVLDPSGRRLAQFDVWRTEAGAWRAGIWSQCID